MEREDEKDCLSKKEKLRKIQKENFEDIFFFEPGCESHSLLHPLRGD